MKNNLLLSLIWNRTSKLLAYFLIFFCIHTIANGQSKDEKKILEVFNLEEEYWNKGDIDAYVSLYALEDSVRMLYSTGAVYGRDNILAFYKKYWPKERMGKLTLDERRLERLSDTYYFVSGMFHVTYTNDRKPVHGRFSGLMKKIKGRWYIYTDHSG